MFTTDIVVIGAGLAGLRAAMSLAGSGLDVLLLAKDRLCTGSSFYPMMDMLACQSADGTPERDALFLQEVLDTSLGMADEEMYRTYIREMPNAVARMPELGIEPRLTDTKPACFAKAARPTYCWSNWPKIRERARSLLTRYGNVRVWEQSGALALLQREGALCGVLADTPDGEQTIACKSAILATGGFGDLYEHSLNTPDVSGDGQVLALQAGARLINLEFLQFIPGFLSPAYKTVFRESTLAYAERMVDSAGKDLLAAYLPIEADRAECLRLRTAHGPFTSRSPAKWFDIAMMAHILHQQDCDETVSGLRIRYNNAILQSTFTFIAPYVRWLREEKQVDIVRDEIRIAPFFHAANGGVRVHRDCQTHVAGLFACGETAGGIHGADRQGGNASGSCLVFGDIAAQNSARYARGTMLILPSHELVKDTYRDLYGTGRDHLTPDGILTPLRKLMWRNANILRSEVGLQRALDTVRGWQADYLPNAWMRKPSIRHNAVKAAHFLWLSQALLMAMLARRESRGAHYREDYPEPDAALGCRFEVHKEPDKPISIEEEGGTRL